MFKIVKREEMAQGTVIMNEIEAPRIAAKAKPGQFVILKANETGERIPLTISDIDVDNGTITIIYMVVGKSTAIFKTLQVGDAFQDVIGPLGKPTHLEKVGKGKKKSAFKRDKAVQERLDKDNQLRLAMDLVETLPRIKSLH